MYRVILIAGLFAATIATEVNRCTNQPFPVEVRIRDCPEQPCIVVKGSHVLFEVDFVAGFSVKNMTTNVRAKLGPLTVPYPLEDELKYACKMLSHGSYCPIYDGEDVTFIFNFEVGTWYPEIGVNIEISLRDENDKYLTCFNTDIQVIRGVPMV